MAAASTERRVVRGNNQRRALAAVARGLDFLELPDEKLILGIARYVVSNNASPPFENKARIWAKEHPTGNPYSQSAD